MILAMTKYLDDFLGLLVFCQLEKAGKEFGIYQSSYDISGRGRQKNNRFLRLTERLSVLSFMNRVCSQKSLPVATEFQIRMTPHEEAISYSPHSSVKKILNSFEKYENIS